VDEAGPVLVGTGLTGRREHRRAQCQIDSRDAGKGEHSKGRAPTTPYLPLSG
jgi:hypothetical protein